MDSSGSHMDLIEQLADEFARRQRRGEQPSLEEYVRRYPELAGEIREVFPALVMMDQVVPAAGDLMEAEPSELAAGQAPPGQLGEYRILREIGRGGMGVVYEAEQESLRRRVALKVLPRELSASAHTLERFLREARAAARLHHTNIVPVFEVGREGDTAYYTMQLIQGQGLNLVIDDLKRLRREHSSRSGGKPRDPASSAAVHGIAASLVSGKFHQESFAADMGGVTSGVAGVERSEPPECLATGTSPRVAGVERSEPPECLGTGGSPLVPRGSTPATRRGSTPATPPTPATPSAPAGQPAVQSSGADQTETLDHAFGSTPSAALPGESEISTAETNRHRFHRSVARIGIQTADALAYAHARGIIHRDIKPSNLILDAGGVVWVSDFGLAKTDEDAMTHTGDILGTMRYMSPERFRGQCDVRADVYSLRLTLYELLLLKPAFESPDRLKLVEMVRQSEPPAPRAVDPRIPRDLETIVLKAIDKDPKRRYQSADDLREDLRRFIADEPIKARRISLPGRLLRWSRRNKGVAAALTAIALLLIAATIGSGIAATYFEVLARRLTEQLQTSKVMRLTAQSQAIRDELPVQSVLLAIEAVESSRRSDGTIMPVAHEALLSSTHNLGGRPLVGHESQIRSLVMTLNGRWLVTGSTDGTARLWDLKAEDPAKSSIDLRGHQDAVTSIGVSSDSRRLVTGSMDNTARLWDLTAPDPASSSVELKGHAWGVSSVAISSDGHWIVTGSYDKTARLWDADDPAKPRLVLKHDQLVTSVTISPDSRWLVTLSLDNAARLWDLKAEDPANSSIVLRGHQAQVTSIGISSDSRRLVTGSRDGTARLWDLTSEDPAASSVVLGGHESSVDSVAIDPNGRWLATGSGDTTVRLWDLTSENPAMSSRVLRGDQDTVSSLAISPDGRWLVTGSWDGMARRWDLTADDPAISSVELRGHEYNVGSIAISPDGRLLVTGSWDGTARLWDLASENPASSLVLGGHDNDVLSVAISPNGRYLVSGTSSGTGRLSALTTEGTTAPSLYLRGYDKDFDSTAVTADGRWLLTTGLDGKFRLLDLTADDPSSSSVVLPGHQAGIDAIAVSPDGRRLVTKKFREAALLWDLTDSSVSPHELPGSEGQIHFFSEPSFAMSPNGRWLATSISGVKDFHFTAHLWDLASKAPASEPVELRGHKLPIISLAISPDSRRLVTTSYDGTCRLWDLTVDDPAGSSLTLHGHEGGVWKAAISPDGRWLATTSFDTTARLRDLTVPDPNSSCVTLAGHTGHLGSVAFSPDNRWLVTGGEDRTARVWDLLARDPASSSLVLRGHRGAISTVAFSRDSRWVVTGSHDRTVRLWDLEIDSLIQRARGLAGRELTLDERKRYGLDGF